MTSCNILIQVTILFAVWKDCKVLSLKYVGYSGSNESVEEHSAGLDKSESSPVPYETAPYEHKPPVAPPIGECSAQNDFAVATDILIKVCPKNVHGSCYKRFTECLSVRHKNLRKMLLRCKIPDEVTSFCPPGTTNGPSNICCLVYELGITLKKFFQQVEGCMRAIYPCCSNCNTSRAPYHK